MAKGAWSVVGTYESSSSDKIYRVQEKDGKFGCDCPAWRFVKNGERNCKHVRRAMQDLGIKDNIDYAVWIGKQRQEEKKASTQAMPEGYVHPLMAKVGMKASKPVKNVVVKQVNKSTAPVATPEPVLEVKKAAAVEEVIHVNPMLAAKGDNINLTLAYNSKDWIAEEKFDGSRYILHVQSNGSRLFSRHIGKGTDAPVEKTDRVPHITSVSVPELAGTVLDGEVTVPSGDFGNVIEVMGSDADKAIAKQGTVKARYNVFDCIRYQGKDISKLPLRERRTYAEKAVKTFNSEHVIIVPQITENKRDYYFEVLARSGEGVILKNLNSPYVEGKRDAKMWVKAKKSQTYDVVIMGYEEPEQWSVNTDGETVENSHFTKGWIASFIFGVYDNGKLIEVGRTSGMSDAIRKDVSTNRKQYLGQVIEVEGQQVLRTSIRHPRFIRFRPDANPKACTSEKLLKS